LLTLTVDPAKKWKMNSSQLHLKQMQHGKKKNCEAIYRDHLPLADWLLARIQETLNCSSLLLCISSDFLLLSTLVNCLSYKAWYRSWYLALITALQIAMSPPFNFKTCLIALVACLGLKLRPHH
jgi:hypothetical protein